MNCLFCQKNIKQSSYDEKGHPYQRATCYDCNFHVIMDKEPYDEVAAYAFRIKVNGEFFEWISAGPGYAFSETKYLKISKLITGEQPYLMLEMHEWIPLDTIDFYVKYIERLLNMKAFI